MSKRAEEAALKAYPIQGKWVGNQYGEWDCDINQELRKAFLQGYEQAEAETIERACDWLFWHLPILVDYYNEDIHENADRSEFIKLFRKQMEEE